MCTTDHWKAESSVVDTMNKVVPEKAGAASTCFHSLYCFKLSFMKK